MTKRYMIWYSGLSIKKKLVVQFMLQWFYWGLAWLVFKKIFPDDGPPTLGKYIFNSTWMAIWMTIFSNWKKVKQVFKRTTTDE